MPTVIHMIVEVSVPVPDKNAIEQAVVTQALVTAAEVLLNAASERGGAGSREATVKRVKAPEPPTGSAIGEGALGDTPETMPVRLP